MRVASRQRVVVVVVSEFNAVVFGVTIVLIAVFVLLESLIWRARGRADIDTRLAFDVQRILLAKLVFVEHIMRQINDIYAIARLAHHRPALMNGSPCQARRR